MGCIHQYPSTMSRLSLFLIFSIVVCVSADSGITDSVLKMQPFTLKSSSYCPIPIIGRACPKGNEITYFKCCGELNKDCCETFQDWVALFIALFFGLIVVAFCICCFC